ncbi:MAG: hypothetical protein ACE5LU_29040, partial [Anaerolineae bacterium]
DQHANRHAHSDLNSNSATTADSDSEPDLGSNAVADLLAFPGQKQIVGTAAPEPGHGTSSSLWPSNGIISNSTDAPGPWTVSRWIRTLSTCHNSRRLRRWDGTYLWVDDTVLEAIFKVDAAGNVLARYPAPGSAPEGLAWDGSSLWIADPATDTIYRPDLLNVTDGELSKSEQWDDRRPGSRRIRQH